MVAPSIRLHRPRPAGCGLVPEDHGIDRGRELAAERRRGGAVLTLERSGEVRSICETMGDGYVGDRLARGRQRGPGLAELQCLQVGPWRHADGLSETAREMLRRQV